MNLEEEFISLNRVQKRKIHFELCRNALSVLENYFKENPEIGYVESIVGTFQQFDINLPADAYAAAFTGKDFLGVTKRYLEPMTAFQDDETGLPTNIEIAYYAIYNLFEKYAVSREIDDLLIVRQALRAEELEEKRERLLRNAIEKFR